MLEEANCKLWVNQLKREEMESYIAQHLPIPEDIYLSMCFDGYQQQFPETMKLFKFTLLILASMACLDRPERLLDKTAEKLINTFIATGCCIGLQFIIYFLAYASIVMVVSLHSFILKKKLLCPLYLNIIHFIWIVHFHLSFSYFYSIILILSIFVVNLSWQLKVVGWIKKMPSLPLMCAFIVSSPLKLRGGGGLFLKFGQRGGSWKKLIRKRGC